jgi:phosphonate transport system permease protein
VEDDVSEAMRTLRLAAATGNLDVYDRAARRRQSRAVLGTLVMLVLFLVSCWIAEVRPSVLVDKFPAFFTYFSDIFHLDSGDLVWTAPADWYWGLGKWLASLGETLLMAYAGTMLGTMAALVFCFLASRNFARSRASQFLVLRFLEFARTVPDLVFALVFVIAFGLGPVPGVLAIAIHTMGTLGKLFAEVVENIDPRPVEGISAAGGSWFAQVRFGALPQVLSNFLSYALLRFEINVRSAAVLGFVGAGGIGYILLVSIRKFYNSDVSAILLLIIATVMLIDYGTERVRHLLVDVERH